MDAPLVARGIVKRETKDRIKYGVADPAIFIRDGGPSIAELMSVEKCSWRRADNKRVPGWEQLRSRLIGRNGVPMLYFSDSCEDTLRTLPVLQHDEKNQEDVDTDSEDHAADELRYAVMSRPWIPRELEDKSITPANVLDMTINQIVARKRQERLNAEF